MLEPLCIFFASVYSQPEDTFSFPCFPYYTRYHTAPVTNLSFSQNVLQFCGLLSVSPQDSLPHFIYIPTGGRSGCFRLPFIINNTCLGLADGAKGHGRFSRTEIYRGTAKLPSGLLLLSPAVPETTISPQPASI